jgi:hypothetical protein
VPQNYPLQLSGASVKEVITVRLLEVQLQRRAVARLQERRLQLNEGVLPTAHTPLCQTSMVQHLYPNFQAHDDQYRAVVGYWRGMVEELAAQFGFPGEWRPWRPTTFADGVTPIPRDLTSIFDARCDRLGRTLQILQSPPEQHTPEIAAWLDTVAAFEKDETEFLELVINLALSVETAVVARKLLEHWLNPAVTVDEMLRVIKELAPGSG